MDPPQSQNDYSPETKKRFLFTAEQLKEIRNFRCSHPDTSFGRGVAGRSVFSGLKNWEVVPYAVCKYGLICHGKEIRPVTDSDDAVILENIVLSLGNRDTFKSVKKKLQKSPYTVNAKALMHRHFDPKDDNIVSSIKAFISCVKETTHDSTTSNAGNSVQLEPVSTTSNDGDSAAEQGGTFQEWLQVRQVVRKLADSAERHAALTREVKQELNELEAEVVQRMEQNYTALAERMRRLEERFM